MMHQDRFKTILVIVTGLLAFSVFFDIDWLGKVALAIGLLSVFIPLAAKAIEWFWLKLALMLGWTNSRILLSIIYFGFLMPIALLSRVFTKDPLSIKGKKSSSLFISRNHVYKKEDLKNVW
ncbi:MAG TPA: SxtJ family membrane protein [Chryseosolibacter sp.]|nr:SxtJ family membrane protein [Chryseosolibacter sp.]